MKLISACLLTALLLTAACTDKKEPLKIGYLGGLTGKVSPLGIEGRNGVELAVQDMNAQGGIHGRTVIMQTADDKQNKTQARAAALMLADIGSAAIIGPMTSAMAVTVAQTANQRQILMISPTTSTGELTGLDDYFFRVYPASSQAAAQLADYLHNAGHKKLLIAYDEKNAAHCESWYKNLLEHFSHNGGESAGVVSFSSAAEEPLHMKISKAAALGTDSLFILANSLDTALLVQQLKLHNINLPIYTSEWSSNKDLITHGGKTVEGVIFFNTFNQYSKEHAYTEFREKYRKAFLSEPGFAAVHAYDSAMVVLTALRHNPDTARLKETILKIRTFKGLQGPISFDEFGDVRRQHFLMTIRNGEFAPLK